MQVWNVLHMARWKHRTQKFAICAQLYRAISSQLRHVSTIGKKNLLNSNTSPTCPYNMVNYGQLAAEIGSLVWGTPANFKFNGFRVLAALLQGTLVVGVSQTLRCWTEGATYIRQGDHHVGHWPLAYILGFIYIGFDVIKNSTWPVLIFSFWLRVGG